MGQQPPSLHSERVTAGSLGLERSGNPSFRSSRLMAPWRGASTPNLAACWHPSRVLFYSPDLTRGLRMRSNPGLPAVTPSESNHPIFTSMMMHQSPGTQPPALRHGAHLEHCVAVCISLNTVQSVKRNSFFAFSYKILRSAALFGASLRIAAIVCEPWQPPPMPTGSLQSLPYRILS